MRICFIADSSSIHVRRIVAYFVRQGHEILVLSTAAQKLDISGVTIAYVLPSVAASSGKEKGNPKSDKRSALRRNMARKCKEEYKMIIRSLADVTRLFTHRKQCSSRIKEFSPDVVIVFRAFPEGLLTCWCGVERVILRTAGSDISYFSRLPILGRFVCRMIRRADSIITESQYEEDYLRQELGVRNPIGVIPIGTDITLFRPSLQSNRAKYELGADSVVVVSNRYLEGFYNGFSVIEAFVQARKLCSNLELLYVSPYPTTETVRERLNAIRADGDGIHIVEGPIPPEEMARALYCGDIWASFSSVDGIPNSLLEAMSCGLVPIVGDLPQLREWVRDGQTGYVVPLKDVKAMADRMVELSKNKVLRATFSLQCRKKICRDGSYEGNMQRMVKFVFEAARAQAINNNWETKR